MKSQVSFPRYERYKDSGAEWLGEVPEHWALRRLDGVFTERREKVSDVDFPPLSVTKNGVVPQLDNAAKTQDGDNRKKVKSGDFVINSRSDRKGSSGISFLDGSVSLINIVLKPKEVNPSFINFLLKSHSFIEEYYRVGRGIVADLWTTRYDEMRTILLAIPEESEQKNIATFLNQKTAQIDQAIDIKKKQIELLKERQQVLIQQAVTKGLDPEVRMRDSGVEWIGEVPEHWEIVRFRNFFKFNRGLNITKENLIDEGIPCVSYGEVHSRFGFEVNPQKHELMCVSNDYLTKNKSSLINKGDIVFADTSEDIEGSGNFTQLVTNDIVFAGYHTIICKPLKSINYRYLAYSLESISYRNQIRKQVKGVKVYSITQSILKNTYIWLPSEREQEEISHYLDQMRSQIKLAIEAEERQIKKLQEYKSSLINSAVTGKIKITPDMIAAEE